MKGRVVSRTGLSQREELAMFALLQQSFEGADWQVFQQDLREKNQVILLEDGGSLEGFSTLQSYYSEYAGKTCRIIYSGDTIISQKAWGGFSLPKTWIAAVNALQAVDPDVPTYWLLLTSGFRTYRFLPVFWRSFYPVCGQETPLAVQRMINHFSIQKFGKDYDIDTGVVRFPHPQPLKRELLEVPAGRESNRHIEFFLKRNPGFERGDELVCFTPLSSDNLTRAGVRMVQGGR